MKNIDTHPFSEIEWKEGYITKEDTQRAIQCSDSHLRRLQRDFHLEKRYYKKTADERDRVCYNLQHIYTFTMNKYGRWMKLQDDIIAKTQTVSGDGEEAEDVAVLRNSHENQIQTKEFKEFIKKVVADTVREELAKFQWPELPIPPSLPSVELNVGSAKRMRLFQYYATGVLFAMFLYLIFYVRTVI